MNRIKMELFSVAAVSLLFLSACQQKGKCTDASIASAAKEKVNIETFEQGENYSQAVKSGNSVILAGQVGDGATMTEQAQNIFNTIDKLLAKTGTDKSKITFANVYLTDMNDFKEFNDAWIQWLADNKTKPARATVQVAKLAGPKWKIEIQVFANI